MNYQKQSVPNGFNQPLQKLPNATTALVLGIISILSCMCIGIPGLILSIIGLNKANKDHKLYQMDPKKYINGQTLVIGRILCIIGLILNIAYLIYSIYFFSMIGFDALTDPQLLRERIMELK